LKRPESTDGIGGNELLTECSDRVRKCGCLVGAAHPVLRHHRPQQLRGLSRRGMRALYLSVLRKTQQVRRRREHIGTRATPTLTEPGHETYRRLRLSTKSLTSGCTSGMAAGLGATPGNKSAARRRRGLGFSETNGMKRKERTPGAPGFTTFTI
jgi:hypothetical protein